jgi:SAM-dependent methyltransferase
MHKELEVDKALTGIDSKLKFLKCPISGEKLIHQDNALVAPESGHTYLLTESGIPQFFGDFCSPDALVQAAHYTKVNEMYIKNLTFPHTAAYTQYIDEEIIQAAARAGADLTTMAEICCGQGESFQILDGRFQEGVGLDISLEMLEHARRQQPGDHIFFLQGDATNMPIESEQFGTVLILGGIHHVNQREALYSEVYRILKPGGIFIWREPVSDLFLWRWLRAAIYHLSSRLNEDTEDPLHFESTRRQMEEAGFEFYEWQPYAFIGFMFLMNSHVLVFNRLFKYIPGIFQFSYFMAKLDRWIVSLPGMRSLGLQVIGIAKKPPSA